MTKDELKEYLKDNLKIKKSIRGDMWYSITSIDIVLEDEIISSVIIDAEEDG